ncbi:UNVERIFIED_ORG: hypothetical protein J2Y77_002059 [Pseudomonas lini]
MDASAVQELAFNPPQPVPDRNGGACSITLRRAASGVLPMSAVGFVAACQHSPLGGLDQLPGRQVKDFPVPYSP